MLLFEPLYTAPVHEKVGEECLGHEWVTHRRCLRKSQGARVLLAAPRDLELVFPWPRSKSRNFPVSLSEFPKDKTRGKALRTRPSQRSGRRRVSLLCRPQRLLPLVLCHDPGATTVRSPSRSNAKSDLKTMIRIRAETQTR